MDECNYSAVAVVLADGEEDIRITDDFENNTVVEERATTGLTVIIRELS